MMISHTLKVRLLQVVMFAALLGLWQGLSAGGVVSSFTLSSPITIGQQIYTWFATGFIWPHLEATLLVLALGYSIGVGAGIVLGMLSGLVPVMRHYLSPFMTFLNAVPRLLITPFLIGWLGFGYSPRVIVTAFVVVFLVAIIVSEGVAEVRGDYVTNARVLGANPVQMLTTVYLPGVGIWLLTSARVSVGLAIQCVLVAELFGAPKGLGYLILSGEQTFKTGQVYAAVVIAMAIAWLLDLGLSRVEARAAGWVPR